MEDHMGDPWPTNETMCVLETQICGFRSASLNYFGQKMNLWRSQSSDCHIYEPINPLRDAEDTSSQAEK